MDEAPDNSGNRQSVLITCLDRVEFDQLRGRAPRGSLDRNVLLKTYRDMLRRTCGSMNIVEIIKFDVVREHLALK